MKKFPNIYYLRFKNIKEARNAVIPNGDYNGEDFLIFYCESINEYLKTKLRPTEKDIKQLKRVFGEENVRRSLNSLNGYR